MKNCQVLGTLGGRDGTFWCSLAYTCVIYGHQESWSSGEIKKIECPALLCDAQQWTTHVLGTPSYYNGARCAEHTAHPSTGKTKAKRWRGGDQGLSPD